MSETREETIEIYADGASRGNPGPAGIGVLLRWQGKEKEISKFIGPSTNNVAELTAIMEGLKAVKRKDLPVVLYTDSALCLGLLTSNWKAKAHPDLVRRIKELMGSFQRLTIAKVTGHAGVRGNERADLLAKRAIEKGIRGSSPQGS